MSSRLDELDGVAHAADQLERVIGERGGASAGSDGSVAADFAAALSAWTEAPARRALRLWYAKALSGTRNDASDLLRAMLTPAERSMVQDAVARGWSRVENGGSIRSLAARHRKDFERSLSSAERRRFWWFLGGARPVPAAAPPGAAPGAAAEPTDAELMSLAIEAFAGVEERNRRAHAEVEARIAERRVEVLARLAARPRRRDSSST